MNGQVEVTWQKFQTIAYSIMVHTQVSDEYIYIVLMYTTDHISPVLPIKHLVNKDGEPTMPHKMATGTKPSVSNLRVLLFPCIVRKATANFYKNVLNMRHQSQKVFLVSSLELHNIKRVPHLCT